MWMSGTPVLLQLLFSAAALGDSFETTENTSPDVYGSLLKDTSLYATNTRKTCSVWKAEGRSSDHLLINPNGEGSPLVVYCDMSTTPASMNLEHNRMASRSIRGPICDSVTCVRSGQIFYFTASLERLVELIGVTRSCRQHVRYDCYNSAMDYTRWLTHDDRVMTHWGGYPSGNYGTMICGCYANKNCTDPYETCNCNANITNNSTQDNTWRVDEGWLTSETSPSTAIELPIKEVGFGRFGSENSIGNYTIGPLICMDRANACPQPPSRPNSTNTANQFGHIAGDTVTYTCNTGYTSDVTQPLRCGEDGRWQGTPVNCQRVNCGDPGTPRSTTRTLQGTKYQNTATYACKPAYKYLSGDRVRTCQANGTWSGEELSCQVGMVAFSVTYSGSHWTCSSSSCSRTVVFDRADINKGNAYSTSTGIFTTPVPGIYNIEFHMAQYSGYLSYFNILVNGSTKRSVHVYGYRAGGQTTYRGSSNMVIQLREGDRVQIQPDFNTCYRSSCYVQGGPHTTFSGYLLEPDQD